MYCKRLKASIVKLYESNQSDEILGLAFWVTPDYLLTSYHSIESYLDSIFLASNIMQTRVESEFIGNISDIALLKIKHRSNQSDTYCHIDSKWNYGDIVSYFVPDEFLEKSTPNFILGKILSESIIDNNNLITIDNSPICNIELSGIPIYNLNTEKVIGIYSNLYDGKNFLKLDKAINKWEGYLQQSIEYKTTGRAVNFKEVYNISESITEDFLTEINSIIKKDDNIISIINLFILAKEKLSLQQVSNILKLNLDQIENSCKNMEQYLEKKDNKYGFKHKEFNTLFKATIDNSSNLSNIIEKLNNDRLKMNIAILEYCEKYWKTPDTQYEYALKFYLYHLILQYDEGKDICVKQKILDLCLNECYFQLRISYFLNSTLWMDDYKVINEFLTNDNDLVNAEKIRLKQKTTFLEVSNIQKIKDCIYNYSKLAYKAKDLSMFCHILELCLLISDDLKKVETFLDLLRGQKKDVPFIKDKLLKLIENLLDTIPDESAKNQLLKKYINILITFKYLNKALDYTVTISDEYYYPEILSKIAKAATDLTNPTEANKILEKVLNLAANIPDEEYRFQSISNISTECINLKNQHVAIKLIENAIEAVSTITNENYCSWAISNIASDVINLEDSIDKEKLLKKAQDITARISNKNYRYFAEANIIIALTSLENIQDAELLLCKAMKTALKITNESSLSLILSNIASATINLELPQSEFLLLKILKTTNNINNEEDRSILLSHIASKAVKLKDQQEINKLLGKILKAVINISDEEYYTQAIFNIAVSVSDITCQQINEGILYQILDLIINISDKSYFSQTLSNFASIVANIQDEQMAISMLGKMFEIASNIDDEACRNQAIYNISADFASIQSQPNDKKYLDMSLEAAVNISDEEYRSEALSNIIMLSEKLPDKSDRQLFLEKVLDAVKNITIDEYCSLALSNLVTGAMNFQNEKEVELLLKKVFEVAIQISDEMYRSWALSNIAIATKVLKNQHEAQKLIEKSFEQMIGFSDKECCFLALSNIIVASVNLKDHKIAHEILTKVLQKEFTCFS